VEKDEGLTDAQRVERMLGGKRPASVDEWQFTHCEMVAFDHSMDRPEGREGFLIQWGVRGIGWGELTFYKEPDGTYRVDNECMGQQSIERIVLEFVRKCVHDDP
jgi:hypothetical protein